MKKLFYYIQIMLTVFFSNCNAEKKESENIAIQEILQVSVNTKIFNESIVPMYEDSSLTIVLTSTFTDTPLIIWNRHNVKYIDSNYISNYSIINKIKQKELPPLELFITKIAVMGDSARVDFYFRNNGITIENYLSKHNGVWNVDSTAKGWN